MSYIYLFHFFTFFFSWFFLTPYNSFNALSHSSINFTSWKKKNDIYLTAYMLERSISEHESTIVDLSGNRLLSVIGLEVAILPLKSAWETLGTPNLCQWIWVDGNIWEALSFCGKLRRWKPLGASNTCEWTWVDGTLCDS